MSIGAALHKNGRKHDTQHKAVQGKVRLEDILSVRSPDQDAANNHVGKSWPHNTDGDTSMTKEQALQAIKLLSALESWAMSQSARLPDYLHEDLQRSMEVLERIVLEKP